MSESELKRLQWLLRYIKEHPFPVPCLSAEQAEQVCVLQEKEGEMTQQEINREVEAIYRKAEDERVFQYDSVVYYEYTDKDKLMKCIGLIYSDDDFNWLKPNHVQPHRFDAIVRHFGFDSFNVSYSYTTLTNQYLEEFRNNKDYKFIQI